MDFNEAVRQIQGIFFWKRTKKILVKFQKILEVKADRADMRKEAMIHFYRLIPFARNKCIHLARRQHKFSYLEQATIAGRQGLSEGKKFVAKPTQPNRNVFLANGIKWNFRLPLYIGLLAISSPLCTARLPADDASSPSTTIQTNESFSKSVKKKTDDAPSHLMVGPGLFNVDKSHVRFMYQIEYRWEPHCHHIRPLVACFGNTDQSFYICGGVGYDIFIGKRFVVTPSFAPGWYHQGRGKNLGFPLNFRSSIEAAAVLGNKGRIGAQFFHISNARMLLRNPGADSLVFYYAIPLFGSHPSSVTSSMRQRKS